jgi:2-polyprenyl-3-methyl-5-hydroxy-6-metoxy-1,4-benzoquinol methylase
MHVVDREGVEPRQIESFVRLEGARVMEVGCGEGRLTGFVAARAKSVYAFDPDTEQVETARARLSSMEARRVRFAVHGAEALDVERERFDVALCGWSL